MNTAQKQQPYDTGGGEYLAGHPQGVAHIVSSDAGYDAAVQMWRARGYAVDRIGNDNVAEHTRNASVAAQMDDETLMLIARSFLSWNGYQEGEKERLAEILVQYVRGSLSWPYSTDIHAAIGHFMQCGKRYTQIYAAERGSIASFLLAMDAA